MEGATGCVDQRGTIAHMKCKDHHEKGRETWGKSIRESRLWRWHDWSRREKASKVRSFQPATNSR